MRRPEMTNDDRGVTGSRMLPTLGLLPVIAVSALAAGMPAMAQEGTVLLDEVRLSGGAGGEAASGYRTTFGSSPKLRKPLAETPKTIAVITQKEMEERNATSVLEVLRTTPGITLGSGEGGTPMGDRPYVRGYQAATDMMIDGVRNLGRTSQEAFATESVEVAKGPGGTYSGRGATGGSINLVSKQAREGENFQHASGTLGNAGQKRLSYDGNFDLGGGLAARLNLMVQDGGVPGRDVLKDDRRGIAFALAKRFGASKLSLNLYHSRSDSTPDLGVPMGSAGYRPALNGGLSFGSGTKADPWRPIELAAKEAFYGSALRDYRRVTNSSAQVKLETELRPGLTWTSTLAVIGSEQDYIVSRPTVVTGAAQSPTEDRVQRDLRSGNRQNSAVAFHSVLTGEGQTGSLKHNYALGVEVSRERMRARASTGSPAVGVTSISNPNPYLPVTGTPLTWTTWNPFVKTDTSALYLFDSMTLSEKWTLDLGLRYDRYEVSDGTRRNVDTMLNYSAGVSYKIAPHGMAYVSFGTSTNPSGECAGMAGGADGASACTLSAGNVNLDPEKNRSFELGTKWELYDQRLLLSAALFRTEKTNARVTDPVTGAGVALAGKSRAQGIELGVAGEINDRWGISAGYTYTDAKWINSGGTRADDGNALQFVGKHGFSLWSTYQVTDRVTLGGGATFTDRRYLTTDNTAVLPSQWRFDAMASFQVAQNTALQINVNNVFDERLYDASHVGLFANRAPGRSITAKLDYRF
ncbi:TonB-dependent receptor [Falsigemmobacter faecalis]|uniref:TonB-dependent siderophore receptor n=1 Tax=Falsigemmobacter faecalis TaxID=2488730 RepID=A0A3P3DPR4_9RHOB|nr:TonB-dependent siderophore receptor [Falsigemmobacter faecalis]RRH76239.1 TonB-dependent siderophore receptor [Falsigemmobacter faecalis]